ncbi:MAG: Gfo/Idh/MocA family oxidoreductase [Acidobacteria bacterium]|nr:Gfo/Idh/MocA family oxidoreductase [Acidobacteriota bacterium]
MYNFAVMGVAGYIAPRHLEAIKKTGNRISAAVDPKDSVGILDQYSLDIAYFKETERFDRFLFKQHKKSNSEKIHYVSICTPNYLHDAHIRLALRNDCNAICEKPLVINPWNLDALSELEEETGRKVYTVLQLRLHPDLQRLKDEIQKTDRRYNVELTYITGRGKWYYISWKGIEEYSGGVATNIGIHLFDLMIWLFGDIEESVVFHRDSQTVSGFLSLKKADVKWFLSLNAEYVPPNLKAEGKKTFRSIKMNEREIEFSEGFANLHTEIYKSVLQDRGNGIEEARKSIELVYRIRKSQLTNIDKEKSHSFLNEK